MTGLEFFPLFERETVICVCSPEYLKQYGSPESTQQLLQRTLLMVEDHYHDCFEPPRDSRKPNFLREYPYENYLLT